MCTLRSEYELTSKPTAKRPFLIYLLTILFFLAGAFTLAATIGIFQAWNWWLAFTSLVAVISRVFLGVLAMLAWISAGIILWRRLPWAVIYCSLVTILSAVWFWIERLFLTNNPLPFNRHALALVITCVFLLFVFSALYLVAPAMKPYQPSQKDNGSILEKTTGDNNDQSAS